ncbi:MAG: hypothetical protein U0792_16995 [Gemmataceae bacterium]
MSERHCGRYFALAGQRYFFAPCAPHDLWLILPASAKPNWRRRPCRPCRGRSSRPGPRTRPVQVRQAIVVAPDGKDGRRRGRNERHGKGRR